MPQNREKTSNYQIRIFICIDDLTQEGIRGWNKIEHQIKINGDAGEDQAIALANKIIEAVKEPSTTKGDSDE